MIFWSFVYENSSKEAYSLITFWEYQCELRSSLTKLWNKKACQSAQQVLKSLLPIKHLLIAVVQWLSQIRQWKWPKRKIKGSLVMVLGLLFRTPRWWPSSELVGQSDSLTYFIYLYSRDDEILNSDGICFFNT